MYKCDSQDLLNELNAEGREKLGLLRDHIDKLDSFAQEKYDEFLKSEAKNFREQYYRFVPFIYYFNYMMFALKVI